MPPRYAYWTILIDNAPTAFRARDQAELLPTFNQLRRKNQNVAFKWFARGRLWDSPEQAQWAAHHAETLREKRGRDWRPGGQHRDPRQRNASEHAGAPKRPSGARRHKHSRAPQHLAPKHLAPKHPAPKHPKKR